MDISSLTIIASIVIALTGIIPGTLALIKQGKKDDKEAKLAEAKLQFDINTATNTALAAVIDPLKTELARCQSRITELEAAVLNKTTEIGRLMEEGIEKDSQILTMKYKMEIMQTKLNSVLTSKRKTNIVMSEEDTISATLEQELKANEIKKEEAKKHTEELVIQLKDKTLMNNLNTPVEGE